jgi:hypothetical protein
VTTLGSQTADTDIETPPKTRSGNIMRRLLRDVAEGRSSATPPGRSPGLS